MRGRGTLVGCVLALCLTGPAAAQIPYTVFDEDTEVGSLDFRFPDGQTLSTGDMEARMELSAPHALAGLRDALSFLPLIPGPNPHPFGVVALQRDVVRIRNLYEESGFIDTRVSYDVQYDDDANAVDVTFVIDEGTPVVLRSLEYETPDGDDPVQDLQAELQQTWRDFVSERTVQLGERLTETGRLEMDARVTDWFRNHGYPFADVRAEAEVDSASGSATLRIVAAAGPRARVGEIRVEGNESVSDDVIRRTFGVDTGDWYSQEAVAAGQRRLFSLDLFRLVLVDEPEEQPHDSTVALRIRVEESPPRLVTGELGYGTVGGLTTNAEFTHRNFTGGARTLRVSGTAETGLLTIGERAAQDYRLGITYRRPFLFHPRLSLNVSPFGEYRDDITDRSWQAGIETSLIYELGTFRYLTLTHRFVTREVLDFRFGATRTQDLADLIGRVKAGALDSVESRFRRSTFALAATIGRWDPLNPTDALQIRPSLEVTAPSGLNTIEYAQVDLPVVGYLPLRNGLALSVRARLGRLFPYGNTFAGDSIDALEGHRLRNVLLTAGGTGSVRGWGNGLVGPKFPDLRFTTVEDGDTVAVDTRGFAPVGGLARALGSVELDMPFPGLGGKWGTHIFLDGAKVWTPDDRIRLGNEDAERWFFGTGLGFDYSTVAGPVRVSIGYKLNPSALDLRAADDIVDALLAGRPVTSAPTDWKRRIHIHVSIGQAY